MLRRGGRVWLPKPNVLPASCPQLKLVPRTPRRGVPTIFRPGTLIRPAWTVRTPGYDRGRTVSSVRAVRICQVDRRATVPVAEDLRPRWPRAKSAQRCAGVHARRNNTALNTATSPNFITPELSCPKKAPDTLHPHCRHCGQDGRAPIRLKAQRVGRARSPLRAGVGRATRAL